MTSQDAGGARDPHAFHDRDAIAGYAAGDASMDERIPLEARIRDCGACASLFDDLRVLAAAMRHLPPQLTNSRDFQLSAADAVRLRGGPWRRMLRGRGLPAWDPRPFAAAFTTLGVAGLLLAVLPFMSLGSAGSASPAAASTPRDQKVVYGVTGGADSASSGTAGVPGAAYGSAACTAGDRASMAPEGVALTPIPTTDRALAPGPERHERETPGSSLVFLSLGFIAAGGALFALGRGTRGSR